MPRLEAKDVQEIAFLARLALTDAEVERLRGELGAILDYVEKLRALDTAGVEPMTHAVPMDCPLREDTAGPSLTADEALGQAPRRDEEFFEVPHILSGSK